MNVRKSGCSKRAREICFLSPSKSGQIACGERRTSLQRECTHHLSLRTQDFPLIYLRRKLGALPLGNHSASFLIERWPFLSCWQRDRDTTEVARRRGAWRGMTLACPVASPTGEDASRSFLYRNSSSSTRKPPSAVNDVLQALGCRVRKQSSPSGWSPIKKKTRPVSSRQQS
jgi:hypothetical protein